MSDTLINIGLILGYVLLGLAALAAVLFSIFQLIVNFKKAKGALIGIVALLVVFFIGYSLATSELYLNVAIPVASGTVSRIIGGAINATFLLIGLALIASVYTEVSKLFR